MKAIPSQTSLFFLVIFTSLFVAGCGQSGVLYLPEKQQQNKPAAEQSKQQSDPKKDKQQE